MRQVQMVGHLHEPKQAGPSADATRYDKSETIKPRPASRTCH
jgi:hypothetical protein